MGMNIKVGQIRRTELKMKAHTNIILCLQTMYQPGQQQLLLIWTSSKALRMLIMGMRIKVTKESKNEEEE